MTWAGASLPWSGARDRASYSALPSAPLANTDLPAVRPWGHPPCSCRSGGSEASSPEWCPLTRRCSHPWGPASRFWPALGCTDHSLRDPPTSVSLPSSHRPSLPPGHPANLLSLVDRNPRGCTGVLQPAPAAAWREEPQIHQLPGQNRGREESWEDP